MASKSTKRKAENPQTQGTQKTLKRHKEQNSSKNKSDNNTKNDSLLNLMKDVRVYILPASIEKARMAIFKTQLAKFGASLFEKLDKSCTHLVVDDKMEVNRMLRLLKLDYPPTDIVIVKTAWLSACFRQKLVVETAEYELNVAKYSCDKTQNVDADTSDKTSDLPKIVDGTNTSGAEETVASTSTGTSSEAESPVKKEFAKVGMMFSAYKHAHRDNVDDEGDADSDYLPSDGEGTHKTGDDSDSFSSDDDLLTDTSGNTSTGTSPNVSPEKQQLPRGHWVCAHSSKTVRPNYNKHITDKLEEMVKTYQSTNDRWRALGYQKAIQSIRKHPKQISSWEEAKALHGVGSRLADKVWEIAESGELRKLNEFRSSEELKVISLFTDVWGAGAHTARTWYQQGFRTLDDLKTKANLTKQQKIGLSHYADFLDRMPRSEVEEIEKTVRDIAEDLVPGTLCEVCGSYRRGKATCGDIDILITHPDGKSHRGIFAKILGRLREQGYLTDDLVTGEENGNQKKYMGVFKLNGENRKHRRIDIIVTPVEEYACALVHFTGSAHFNRSVRHLAKKMGMSLSEHALKTGVIRKGGEKIFEGTSLPTPTEESIFRHMGIPYRPPDERDH